MGSRASYVIVEGGTAQAYYAQWGGETVANVLVDGPEATVAEVRGLEAWDTVIDGIWAEGGIALDLDRRQLRFFTWRMRLPFPRRALLPALRMIWADWDVAWAEQGIVDVAAYFGLDASRVLDTSDEALGDVPGPYNRVLLEGTAPTASDATILKANDKAWPGSILTVRWPDGTVSDYRLGVDAANALASGPRLLELVRGAETVALPREDASNLPHSLAYADVQAQRIWLGANGTVDPRVASAVARRWSGWEVCAHIEGIVRQVELSGRDPPLVRVPDSEAVNALLDVMMSPYGRDEARKATMLASFAEALSRHITVASAGANQDGGASDSRGERDVQALTTRLRAMLLACMRRDASPDEAAT